MGTGPFAVPTVRWLLESEHDIQLVVTRPTVTGGRRSQRPATPVRDIATATGISILDPPDVNDSAMVQTLREYQADLLFVCDYGQLLSKECLSTTKYGGINLHGSLLPRYRGAAPINWAIYHGESETGVSVIHMTPQLDGGPLLAVGRLPIGPAETAAQLEPRMAELGVSVVRDAIPSFERLGRTDDAGRSSRSRAGNTRSTLKEEPG